MSCPEGWLARDGYRACNHCGSMHPDDLFEAICGGCEIVGTDKNYKIYVNPGHRKFYFEHFSEAQRLRFIELFNSKQINLEPRFGLYVWPYFMRPKGD